MATFHSIAYPLAIDAGLSKVADERDYAQHVEQLIVQVLLTNPGERINRPTFGCGLRRIMFAPNSDAGAALLKVTILQALSDWLGTVIAVNDVVVTAANETMSVLITYTLRARNQTRSLNLEVGL